jgi:CoA:oxalate CoA-transferase
LDLAGMWAAPGISMYLGDQGAEVIKVEPRTGDLSRTLGTTPYLKENSRSFMVVNRNKRGITVDTRKPAGKEIVLKLAGWADVLIENFRPGVTERLGIGYDDLAPLNPRLIYCSVSGYGRKGPYAEKAAYDRILQGLSGAMFRRMPSGEPIGTGIWIADCSVPMMMSYGIMLALWQREKTGLGQRVNTSLLQAAIAMQSVDLVMADDDPTPRGGEAFQGTGIYRCGDGVYINVVALADHQFMRLLQVMDLGHLTGDPRAKDPLRSAEFRNEVSTVLQGIFETRSAEEWLQALHTADVPCGPILTRDEVFEEPQVLENEMLVRTEHPAAGRLRMLGIPLELSATPGSIRRPAPRLGEHTDEVLREFGYSADEIGALRAEEVI